MRLLRLLIVVALAVCALASCKSLKDPTRDWTAQRFYQEAKDAMANGNYADAIERFQALEARYPYGRYAEQAQLEIAYAYYKNDQPELAIQAADRFIRLHPTHPNAAYAYYLKGLVNVREERTFGTLLKGGRHDILDRDAKSAQEAYQAFREVVERFPSSLYARDAALRMAYLHNSLANYEVSVARFYLRRGAYVAAANRCKYALENYRQAPATEDALGLMAEAYQQMGLTGLKDDTLRVLAMNFPTSHYLAEINNPTSKKTNAKKHKKEKRQVAGD